MSGIGAGGHFVRLNGRVYEALAARVERRPACDFYHSALLVEVAEGALVIEQAPVRDLSGRQRGVVAEALSAVAGQADFGSFATSHLNPNRAAGSWCPVPCLGHPAG